MITKTDVTWNFIPYKVNTKTSDAFQDAVTRISGNLRGKYEDHQCTIDFNIALQEPTNIGSFIEYDQLSTLDLISFIESSIDNVYLENLKDMAMKELYAKLEINPSVEIERNWSN